MGDRVAHDHVDQGRRELAGGPGRLRLWPQPGLVVRKVAPAELVVPRARDARLAAGLDHADLTRGDPIEDPLAQTCEAICRGHDVLLPILLPEDGRRMLVVSVCCTEGRGVCTSNAGTTR